MFKVGDRVMVTADAPDDVYDITTPGSWGIVTLNHKDSDSILVDFKYLASGLLAFEDEWWIRKEYLRRMDDSNPFTRRVGGV